jgi:hypothetical protein
MAAAGVVEFVIRGTTLDGKLEQIEPIAYRRLAEMQRVGDTA